MALNENPHRSRSIRPVVRTKIDGEPLLPGEIPMIPYYQAKVPPRRESCDLAEVLFERLAAYQDHLDEQAVSLVDRWQIVDPLPDEAVPEEHTWGESGELIEQWFRTGEYLLADDESEPESELTWLDALCERMRRIWARSAEPALNAAA